MKVCFSLLRVLFPLTSVSLPGFKSKSVRLSEARANASEDMLTNRLEVGVGLHVTEHLAPDLDQSELL